MDPGYSVENRDVIESNARRLNIPITVLKQIFLTLFTMLTNIPATFAQE